MLRELHVKNIVLIESLNINFKQGLSVLTGETGAGKSILLDSIGLILGNRVDILIVGGGLSGLLAAKKLAGTNKDVLLIERENELGGILKNSNKVKSINDQEALEWLEKTERL